MQTMKLFSLKPELPNRSEIIARMKKIEGKRPAVDHLADLIREEGDLWDDLIEERRMHEESRRRMQALSTWLVTLIIIAFVCGAAVAWGFR